jgi:hypothetical protein
MNKRPSPAPDPFAAVAMSSPCSACYELVMDLMRDCAHSHHRRLSQPAIDGILLMLVFMVKIKLYLGPRMPRENIVWWANASLAAKTISTDILRILC